MSLGGIRSLCERRANEDRDLRNLFGIFDIDQSFYILEGIFRSRHPGSMYALVEWLSGKSITRRNPTAANSVSEAM